MDPNIQTGAARNNLDIKGIWEMYQLVDEIGKRLLPFKLQNGTNRVGLSVRHRNMILKVCIAGAFYPNYFLRSSCISHEEQERQIFHDLNMRDPTNTVFYRGIGKDEMGMLYENQVKNFLKNKNVIKSKDDVVVSFDEGSQKMYVTFVEKQDIMSDKCFNDSLPGKIKTQIYKSIKLTREGEVLRLQLIDRNEMYNYAERVGLGRRDGRTFVHAKPKMYAAKLCCVPRLQEKKVAGVVTNVRTPNKFWIRPLEQNHDFVMEIIEEALKRKQKPYPVNNLDEIVGKKLSVELEEGFYRARVESVIIEEGVTKFKVFLIDEGTEKTVVATQLKSISDIKIDALELGIREALTIPLADIPPRVFEATLAEIRPSYLASSSGKWTLEAIEIFKNLTKEPIYSIEVYSFWNGVVSVILHDKNGKSINEHLIERQLAEACEESYPSKYDHALRFKTQNFSDQHPLSNAPYQEIDEYLKEFYREPIKPPPKEYCTTIAMLRGPYSPLETTIHPTIRSLYNKVPSIERFSVNSVLLDTDSNDPTDRLVVAATCGSNSTGNNLILRSTTIMPNIHGFGAMMAMLFAPKVEIHHDQEGSRFNSVLCGLGYDRAEKRGYFEEHDLIMNLDCALDQDDLLQVS